MAKRKHKQPRRCPDCGDVHRRDEECTDDLYPDAEDEAFGLGAFIGSLLTGLGAIVERRQRRQQQRVVSQPQLKQAAVDEGDVIDVEYEVIEDETKPKGATTHDATNTSTTNRK